MSFTLLRSGTVLVHDKDDHVTALENTDILIKDNEIVNVDQSINAPEDAEIIDCTNKLISPGFVDTRIHLCS